MPYKKKKRLIPKQQRDTYTVRQHKKVRKSCRLCETSHTENEERFHGLGSFARTHVGYCSVSCCGTQKQKKCYVKSSRKTEEQRKTRLIRAHGYISKNKRR